MPLRKVILDPPRHMAVGVTRIILHWSFQIWMLQKVTYALLDVNMKQGRVAVRDPRPEEYVPMIEELMALGGFTTAVDLNALRENLRELKTLRDAIAHGVWMQGDKHIIIQFVGGNWQPPGSNKKTSRKVVPEGRPVTGESLESIRVGIRHTIRETEKLFIEIEQQALTLHGRQPEQSPSANLPDDPK